MENIFKDGFTKHQAVINACLADNSFMGTVAEIADAICDAYGRGGKVLLCGNGGSASDAQHIAAELVSRFYKERAALSAESLTVNTSSLTAIANDYDYELVFARQVEAFGREGDILIGFSTSGNSANVIKAMEQARAAGMKTIGFTGERTDTGIAKASDICLHVPSGDTPRIQEVHILAGHLVCEYIEEKLFGNA